jgi:hypothetical protein
MIIAKLNTDQSGIRASELKVAMNGLKNKMSGVDGIPTELLKHSEN